MAKLSEQLMQLAFQAQEMAMRARALEAALDAQATRQEPEPTPVEALNGAAEPRPKKPSRKKPPAPHTKVYAKEQRVRRLLERLGRASYRRIKEAIGDPDALALYRLHHRGEVRRNDDGTFSLT